MPKISNPIRKTNLIAKINALSGKSGVKTNSSYTEKPLQAINYPEFINAINLCNDVHKDKNGKYSGDSVEIALKNYLNTIDLKCLISEKNKLIELPFD